MLRYIVKRILQAIPLLLVISVICFALIQLAPYDAIDTFVTPNMAPEVVAALKVRFGLDQPAYVQYWRWLLNTVQGNFGFSLITHESVAGVLAIVLGLVAGSNRGGKADRIIDALCSIGLATPTFWIGMIILYLFAYKMNLLPVLGMHTMGQENNVHDLLAHMILPCTVLTISFLPETVRYVRSSTISQFKEDYVMVQKAFGASRAHILFKHVMKNVLFPVITLVAIALPTLVTGAFITESIFSWPGVGTYFLAAIKGFDYPVIMAVLLLSSAMVILGNLLGDILYCLVDPRIKAMR